MGTWRKGRQPVTAAARGELVKESAAEVAEHLRGCANDIPNAPRFIFLPCHSRQ